MRTLGERSFQYIGHVIWNSLSFSVRHATSLSSFKSKLKPTSSLLPTDFSLSFFCFHQTHDYYACGVCGCGMLICFVSALDSHEMGRRKLPITIILFWGWPLSRTFIGKKTLFLLTGNIHSSISTCISVTSTEFTRGPSAGRVAWISEIIWCGHNASSSQDSLSHWFGEKPSSIKRGFFFTNK